MLEIEATLGFYCEDLSQAETVWESIKSALDDAHSVYSEEATIIKSPFGRSDLDECIKEVPKMVLDRMAGR